MDIFFFGGQGGGGVLKVESPSYMQINLSTVQVNYLTKVSL